MKSTDYTHYLDFLRTSAVDFDKRNAWGIVAPRAYRVPNGYASPKLLSAQFRIGIEDAAKYVQEEISAAQTKGVPMTDEEQSAAHLQELVIVAGTFTVAEAGNPIYFVDRDFLADICCAEPPMEMQPGDITWPFAALSFALPLDFAAGFLGQDLTVPFITLTRPSRAEFESIVAENPEFSEVARIAPQFVLITYSVGLPTGECRSLAAIWHGALSLRDLYTSNEHTRVTGRAGVYASTQEKIVPLAIQLLLGLLAMPEQAEEMVVVKQPKTRSGYTSPGLWNPRWLGRKYGHARREYQGGTHTSPRMHPRVGHFRLQRHGKQLSLSKVVYIKPVWVNKHLGEEEAE